MIQLPSEVQVTFKLDGTRQRNPTHADDCGPCNLARCDIIITFWDPKILHGQALLTDQGAITIMKRPLSEQTWLFHAERWSRAPIEDHHVHELAFNFGKIHPGGVIGPGMYEAHYTIDHEELLPGSPEPSSLPQLDTPHGPHGRRWVRRMIRGSHRHLELLCWRNAAEEQ